MLVKDKIRIYPGVTKDKLFGQSRDRIENILESSGGRNETDTNESESRTLVSK